MVAGERLEVMGTSLAISALSNPRGRGDWGQADRARLVDSLWGEQSSATAPALSLPL